ncbi:hypothetical protein K2P97_07685 [bacterium]|nr:hypothetical protein [bacterium]
MPKHLQSNSLMLKHYYAPICIFLLFISCKDIAMAAISKVDEPEKLSFEDKFISSNRAISA